MAPCVSPPMPAARARWHAAASIDLRAESSCRTCPLDQRARPACQTGLPDRPVRPGSAASSAPRCRSWLARLLAAALPRADIVHAAARVAWHAARVNSRRRSPAPSPQPRIRAVDRDAQGNPWRLPTVRTRRAAAQPSAPACSPPYLPCPCPTLALPLPNP